MHFTIKVIQNLMFWLRRIKCSKLLNLSNYNTAPRLQLLSFFANTRQSTLFSSISENNRPAHLYSQQLTGKAVTNRIKQENAGNSHDQILPILITHIRTLPEHLPWIMTSPKYLQELSVTNHLRVILYLYNTLTKTHIKQIRKKQNFLHKPVPCKPNLSHSDLLCYPIITMRSTTPTN